MIKPLKLSEIIPMAGGGWPQGIFIDGVVKMTNNNWRKYYEKHMPYRQEYPKNVETAFYDGWNFAIYNANKERDIQLANQLEELIDSEWDLRNPNGGSSMPEFANDILREVVRELRGGKEGGAGK